MKKEPTTMSGRKNTQLNMSPRASFVCNNVVMRKVIHVMLLLSEATP